MAHVTRHCALRISAAIAAGSVTALVAAGCGAHATVSRSQLEGAVVPSTASSAALQAVPGAEVLRTAITTHPNAVLSAPPSDSDAVAIATAQSNVEKVSGPLTGYTAELASYTNKDYGEVAADGSFTPTLTNSLVWAFVKTGSYSGNSGGMVGRDGTVVTPTLKPGATCTGVWLASATTGAYLMGFSDCG